MLSIVPRPFKRRRRKVLVPIARACTNYPKKTRGSINDYAFSSSSCDLGYFLLLPGLGTRLYLAMISDVNISIAMCTYPQYTDHDSPVYRICLCLRWISDVWIIQQVLYSLQNLKVVNYMSLHVLKSYGIIKEHAGELYRFWISRGISPWQYLFQ